MADESTVAPGAPSTPAPGQTAGGETGGSPAPTRESDLLARLTAQGREAAAARQKAEQLERLVHQQTQQLQGVTQQLTAAQQAQYRRERDEFEARLAQMSPADAAEARARDAQQMSLAAYQNSLRMQQLSQYHQSAPRSVPSADEVEAAKAQRSAAILDEVNRKYGLPSGHGVTVDDLDDDAWKDPETFRSAAATAARIRAKDPDVQARAKASTPEGMRDEIKREVLAELGVGRGLSAEAAGGSYREAGSEHVAKVASSIDPHLNGIGKSLAEMKRLREELAGRVPTE